MRRAKREKPTVKLRKQAPLRRMEKTTNHLIVVQVLQSSHWMMSDVKNVNVKCVTEENVNGENAFVGNVNE
jgi:hypothetical protein